MAGCNLLLLLRVQASRHWLMGTAALPVGYIQVRGKKQAKKQKSKKELKKEMLKDYVKKLEMEQLKQSAALKAASRGEPLDPEMLNPARQREHHPVPQEEAERRYLLVKEWSRYRMAKHIEELKFIQGAVQSREKALRELRKISFPLYQQALELNPKLFPFERQGPTHTPLLPGYEPPEIADG